MFRQAEGFILRSKPLHDTQDSDIQRIRGKRTMERPRFVALPGYRRVEHYRGSRIQVHAADEGTGDGVIFDKAFLDELHRHKNLGLLRTWTGKRSKRQGQVVVISTAGEMGSEFEKMREAIRQSAKEVKREGCFTRAVSGGIVLHEWAVPEDGDVEDFELVKAANPFSAITVEALAEKFGEPTMSIEHWGRFTCNLPGRSGNPAIQEAEWFRARIPDQIPEGQAVWVGLDVAWKWDTTAAVPLWVRDDHHRLLGPAVVLVPPRDGESLDPELVHDALRRIHRRNPIHTLVMDMSWAQETANWAQAELGCQVVDRGQKNEYAVRDYQVFMEALRSGWLKHTGDAALTRHVLNAAVRVLPTGDARFDRPSRSRAAGLQGQRVIDALTAAAMVHSTAIAVEPEVVFAAAWA